jgi:PAS domain S-box-containing protein
MPMLKPMLNSLPEERFQLVVEAAPNAMLMVRADGLIALVNTQTEKLFGYDRSELLGRSVEMLVPERFRGSHGAHRAGFFAAPATRSMGVGRDLFGLRRDGSEVPIEIGLNPIPTAEGHFVLASIIDITERKKTEERFQLVVEAAPNAMLMVGAGGLIALVNAQTEKLFGYDRRELLGRSMEMLVPERFRGSHGAHRTEFFVAPATRSMGAGRDLFGLRRDGSEVPIEIGLNPIRTADGQFVLASIIDITERKKSEERFQLVVEAAPNAMLMVGAGGVIALVNAQTEKLFGYNRRELLGRSMEMLVPERFRGSHGAHQTGFFAAPAARNMGSGRDLFGLRRDGSEVPIEIGLNPINTPDGQFVLASIIDITERRKFQGVLEAAPDAIVVVDAENKIVLVNGQTETLFGYTRSDLVGSDLEVLLPERLRRGKPGERTSYLGDPAGGTAGSGPDIFGLRSNGSEFPAEIRLSQVPTPDGMLVAAAIRDVTERKRFEAELQSKNAEMERFTYTVSHDLKSPLITIKSFVAMIEQDLASGNQELVHADLGRIARATDKMNRLLDEVLALSRMGRVVNAPENVAFGSVVAEALELVAGRIEKRGIQVEVDQHLPDVMVDRRRMVEVMQNLIDNSAKYMGAQTQPRIAIGVCRDGAEGRKGARFFVRDNGLGIEEKYHARIFGLFDKLNPASEGSGVGLALVKRIVEMHGGKIWVDSTGAGGGSTFWFTLSPLGETDRPAEADRKGSEHADENAGHRRSVANPVG